MNIEFFITTMNQTAIYRNIRSLQEALNKIRPMVLEGRRPALDFVVFICSNCNKKITKIRKNEKKWDAFEWVFALLKFALLNYLFVPSFRLLA